MSIFLPEEIIENIVTRLPVKSISRFRCVSKYCYHLFRNPNFIKNHLNHANLMNRFNILVINYGAIDNIPAGDIATEPFLYSIDNDVLTSTSSPFLGHALEIDYPFMTREDVPMIIGSCDGLVCISEPCPEISISIWNPATREYKQVPEPDWESYFLSHGFGFDCKNDDYKLLGIESYGEGEDSEAGLYSLASNSWKELGIIPYDFSSVMLNKGLLVNGVLHWITTDPRTALESGVVVCYDISDETFHHVTLPNRNPREIGDRHLGVWEGKLCLLSENHMEDSDICTHQNDHIDVWTMMDNKWSKQLKITADMTDVYYISPIETLQNGEILFAGGTKGERGVGLISYDPNLDRVRALKIHDFPEWSDEHTYIETLVALNSGTYVWQQQREQADNND